MVILVLKYFLLERLANSVGDPIVVIGMRRRAFSRGGG